MNIKNKIAGLFNGQPIESWDLQDKLIEHYTTCTIDSYYSNTQLVHLLNIYYDGRIRRIDFNKNSIAIKINSGWLDLEKEIPLSQLNKRSIEIDATEDYIPNILRFFGECELEISRDIRATWFPLCLIYGFPKINVADAGQKYLISHIQCPKNGTTYRYMWLNNKKILIEISWIVLGYYGE